MSFHTTGPGDIKLRIKITVESDSIQDKHKVNTFSCQIITLNLRPQYFNLNPKAHLSLTQTSLVFVHRADCTAVLYTRNSFSSKQHNPLEEEMEVKTKPSVQMSS